jgi:hypothetical protein
MPVVFHVNTKATHFGRIYIHVIIRDGKPALRIGPSGHSHEDRYGACIASEQIANEKIIEPIKTDDTWTHSCLADQ